MSAPNAGAGRPRIVVVEDDADVRAMVTRLLTTLGDVTGFTNGAEALASLRGGTAADLIVTDVMMPQMDGLTLSKELKKDPHLSRIPVVMLTAKSGAASMIEGINAGARHYVTKPFKPDDLLAKAKKALSKK
jgi:CheY-like chemotaxis protein